MELDLIKPATSHPLIRHSIFTNPIAPERTDETKLVAGLSRYIANAESPGFHSEGVQSGIKKFKDGEFCDTESVTLSEVSFQLEDAISFLESIAAVPKPKLQIFDHFPLTQSLSKLGNF